MAGLLDGALLKRIAFRSETTTRVKDLRGFAKGHAVPDRANSSGRKFIYQLAAPDLQADIETIFQQLRDQFGYKRRQLETSTDETSGVIRTPHFTYAVQLLVNRSDPTRLTWRRETSAFRDPQTVRGPAFQQVFGKLFSTLVLDFAAPIDIAGLIDVIEEDSRPGVKVTCASDASWGEIAIKGFRGAIRIEPKTLTISGGRSPTAASLLDLFLAFQQQAPPSGWPALE